MNILFSLKSATDFSQLMQKQQVMGVFPGALCLDCPAVPNTLAQHCWPRAPSTQPALLLSSMLRNLENSSEEPSFTDFLCCAARGLTAVTKAVNFLSL